MEYSSIGRPKGTNNNPGVHTLVYFAPIGEFTTISGFDVTTDPGDSVTISTAHVFPATQGFVKWETTQDTGKLESEPVGERDSAGEKFKFSCFIPGLDPIKEEQMAVAKHDEGIYIIEDVATGKKIQIGTSRFPAMTRVKRSTGTVGGGKKGYELEIEYFGNSLAFYDAAVTLKS